MADRLQELGARIAARRARDLERWQAAHDAAQETDHTCCWCGKPGVYMSHDGDRLGWCCKRCASPRVPADMMTIPQMAARYDYRTGYLRHQSTTGDLAVVRIGSRVYVSKAEAQRWIESRDPALSAAARRRWAR